MSSQYFGGMPPLSKWRISYQKLSFKKLFTEYIWVPYAILRKPYNIDFVGKFNLTLGLDDHEERNQQKEKAIRIH